MGNQCVILFKNNFWKNCTNISLIVLKLSLSIPLIKNLQNRNILFLHYPSCNLNPRSIIAFSTKYYPCTICKIPVRSIYVISYCPTYAMFSSSKKHVLY